MTVLFLLVLATAVAWKVYQLTKAPATEPFGL